MFEFKEIVSGKRRGMIPFFSRLVLKGFSIPYSMIIRIRNILYDSQLKTIHCVSVPVISVGNLTLGGTGKTPLVEMIANFYGNRGHFPGLISRGYHSSAQNEYFEDDLSEQDRPFADFLRPNDEAREIAIRIPDLPHFQNPNRFEAAKAILRRFPDRDILILDDAFQHRKMNRDLDIVILDALQPFGFDHIFPRGMLREPLSGLKRADIILLSRADLISSQERLSIRKKVNEIASSAVWGEIQHNPEFIFQGNFSSVFPQAKGLEKTLFSDWKRCVAVEQSFIAFCGLGNPEGFFQMLKKEKICVQETIVFPDHHCYTERDFQELEQLALKKQVFGLLTTMKDLVKIQRSQIGNIPLYAVQIGLRFLSGENEFKQKLINVLEFKK